MATGRSAVDPTGWPASPGALDPASSSALTRAQLGMYVFLASDLMLFAPFFAAYFLLRTNAPSWPPDGVDLDVARAAAGTAALVASSLTLVAADRAFERRDRTTMRRWLVATLVLGAAFLANQVAEYATLPFAADDHTYGSIYWLLTGLHACHVAAGLLALSALLVRTWRARPLAAMTTWAGGISAFWHLVDAVWLAVFTTVWVIR